MHSMSTGATASPASEEQPCWPRCPCVVASNVPSFYACCRYLPAVKKRIFSGAFFTSGQDGQDCKARLNMRRLQHHFALSTTTAVVRCHSCIYHRKSRAILMAVMTAPSIDDSTAKLSPAVNECDNDGNGPQFFLGVFSWFVVTFWFWGLGCRV